MDQSNAEYLKGAVESLLFVSEKPVTLEQLKETLEGVSVQQIVSILSILQKEYAQGTRGMVIVEIAGGYQMLTSPQHVTYIRRFYKTIQREKLSKPALETLAIVAYKQPVCRQDIELIRGVNSDGVVMHLLNKGLIKIVGRKDVVGKPYLYGTTKQFLEYFGLKSLEDMPKIEEFFSLNTDSQESTSMVTEKENQNNPDLAQIAVDNSAREETVVAAVPSYSEAVAAQEDSQTKGNCAVEVELSQRPEENSTLMSSEEKLAVPLSEMSVNSRKRSVPDLKAAMEAVEKEESQKQQADSLWFPPKKEIEE